MPATQAMGGGTGLFSTFLSPLPLVDFFNGLFSKKGNELEPETATDGAGALKGNGNRKNSTDIGGVKGEWHHIASDKAIKSGFIDTYKEIFDKAGILLNEFMYEPAGIVMYIPVQSFRGSSFFHYIMCLSYVFTVFLLPVVKRPPGSSP
jgi:hypothetical protein